MRKEKDRAILFASVSEFKNIVPGLENYNLAEEIAKFDPHNLILIFAGLNFVISDINDQVGMYRESIGLLNEVYHETRYELLKSILIDQLTRKGQLTIIHRGQLILLIKLLLSKDIQSDLKLNQKKDELIKMLLVANSKLSPNILKDKVDKKEMLIILERLRISGRSSNWWVELIRYYKIYKYLNLISNNFNTYFKEIYGFSLDKYFQIILCFVSHFEYLKTKGAKVFKSLDEFILSKEFFKNIKDINEDEVKSYFDSVALDFTGFSAHYEKARKELQNSHAYSQIWKFPFLKYTTGQYLLLDYKSLQDQMGVGIFWKVMDLIRPKLKDEEIKQMNADFGKAYEEYVREILNKTLLSSDEYVFLGGDIKGKKSCVNFIIFKKPNIFILLESTISTLQLNFINELKFEAFEQAIENTMFGSSDHPQGKFKQFKDSEFIALNEFKEKIGEIKSPKFIKILVQERSFPFTPALSDSVYEKIYKKRCKSYDRQLDYIYYLSISDLEHLFQVNNEIPIEIALEEFRRSDAISLDHYLSSKNKFKVPLFLKDEAIELSKKLGYELFHDSDFHR